MVKKLAVRRGYRFYAAVLVLWSVFSVLRAGTPVDVSATTMGYDWFLSAIYGGVLTVELVSLQPREGPGRLPDRDPVHRPNLATPPQTRPERPR